MNNLSKWWNAKKSYQTWKVQNPTNASRCEERPANGYRIGSMQNARTTRFMAAITIGMFMLKSFAPHLKRRFDGRRRGDGRTKNVLYMKYRWTPSAAFHGSST
jgi:hypothetical protein